MNYDAVVIGTGFGATIAATRLVERGKRVVVLERGTWWVTPESPEQLTATKNLYAWIKGNNQPVQHFLRSDDNGGLLAPLSAWCGAAATRAGSITSQTSSRRSC